MNAAEVVEAVVADVVAWYPEDRAAEATAAAAALTARTADARQVQIVAYVLGQGGHDRHGSIRAAAQVFGLDVVPPQGPPDDPMFEAWEQQVDLSELTPRQARRQFLGWQAQHRLARLRRRG